MQVTDTVTYSVQSECPQFEVTAHLFNSNSNPVQQCVVSSGGETGENEQCSPSLISCTAEELNCQPLQKSSVENGAANVQQLHLREQCVFTGSVKQKGDNRDGALLSGENMQQNFLAGNAFNGNCVHEMAEEINETYTEFANGIATGSARNCASTQGNQHMNAVHNMECMGDAEMNEVESLASEILTASNSCDKFPALTQAHLRDTEISDHHKAETLVFSDGYSDSSTVIINTNDSVSGSVHVVCESDCADQGGESSDSAELHGSNIGCTQKLASG
jgi:hypothetical protein